MLNLSHNLKVACARYIKLVVKITRRNYSNQYHNVLKLENRGMISIRFPPDCDEFNARLTDGKLTAYCGFDPTADSLHIGNLLVLISLIHFQRGGHQPIALVGSTTASIGDPTGCYRDRQVIPKEEIINNTILINKQIKNIFENHENIFWQEQIHKKQLPPLILLDNKSWLNTLKLYEFLNEAGKSLRLSQLLKTNSIKDRLHDRVVSPTLMEFLYQVVQAYDWMHLYEKYNCTVQIGGNDQLGNITIGHDLIKKQKQASVTGLLVPIVTSEDKIKLGKSEGNAIWLNPDKSSPFNLYQYFLRKPDSEVEYLLKLFTFMNLDNIANLMEAHRANSAKRSAQKKLAEKVTLLVHGKYGLEMARRGSKLLYGNDMSTLAEMDEREMFQLFGNATVTTLEYNPEMTILDCAMRAMCFPNKQEGIRIIEEGGFRINFCKVTTPNLILIPGSHILPNNLTILRVGKVDYHLLRWQS